MPHTTSAWFFFGDSLTQGVNDALMPGGWVSRLAVLAHEAGLCPIPRATFYNLGARRHSTAKIAARWRSELDNRLIPGMVPHLVFCAGVVDMAAPGGGQPADPEQAAVQMDKLLAEARFMEEANSYPGAKWLIQHLDRVGYPYAVCTHRGYHIDGYNHTVRAIGNLTGRYVPVYALNIGKGKHEFINQILRMSPYQQYLLVDDNVVPWSSEGNGVDAKHWASQICVDQSWNRTSHTGYARVVTLDSVVVALIDRIKQNTRHLDVGMACRAEIDHVLWQLDRLVKSDPAFPEPEERATGHFKMRAFAKFRLHIENAEKIAMQYQPHSPLACFWTP